MSPQSLTAGEEREISHVLPLLFTLTHALSHPGSSRAHLGLAEGRGEAGWAQADKTMCENKRDPSIPAGWLLLPWALCEQLSPLSAAGPSLPGASSSVCAQLLSVPASGPHLAREGDVPCFRRAMQKAPAAGQPRVKFGCICEVQHNPSRVCSSVEGESMVGEQSRVSKQ